MRLLRYSRLIDEINEDQLDDQMDDEGSGSDSENSEVQGSTDSLPDESMSPKSFWSGLIRSGLIGSVQVRGSLLKTTNMEITS